MPVILNSHDWPAAFDKLDPTMVAVKCIKIGIKKQLGERVYRLHEWQENGSENLPENMSIPLSNHGSPQGSLIGQLFYIIGSDYVGIENQRQEQTQIY